MPGLRGSTESKMGNENLVVTSDSVKRVSDQTVSAAEAKGKEAGSDTLPTVFSYKQL